MNCFVILVAFRHVCKIARLILHFRFYTPNDIKMRSTISEIRLPTVLLLLTFFINHANAQQLKMSQGISLTDFNYQNNMGQSLEGLKSGSGLSFQLAYHKVSLFDSTKILLNQTPFSIYLNLHPKVAQFLRLINYDVGFQINQFNAVGDLQNIPFSYQTNYLGIFSKLGVGVHLPYKSTLRLQGILSVNKLIQGNQLLLSRYIDLTNDPQFSGVKWMGGLGFELEKLFSNRFAAFFSYQQTQTLYAQPINQSLLNIHLKVVSLGIRF